MANLNAQKSLIGLSKNEVKKSLESPLILLKDLKLTQKPHTIFGCDISHYYGTNIVSSVVVFVNGEPEKNIIGILILKQLRVAVRMMSNQCMKPFLA